MILLTNNPRADEIRINGNQVIIDFREIALVEVITSARDMIHRGHKLLSAPLSGSVKPNETPFKSILLSSETAALDMQGLAVIESALNIIRSFPALQWNYTDEILHDFMEIDIKLMSRT